MQHPLKSKTLFLFTGLTISVTTVASPIVIHQSPLFLTTAEKANVLVILDNSNSMDEAPNGSAVGSASPDSKSEIAREAVKDMIVSYTGKINMGLMAYQQAGVVKRQLHNSPYDASFNPANYDPSFTGSRDSLTKRFSMPNNSNPGTFIYYNIALPFYADANFGDAFCYSATADFDNGSEDPISGPWDSYDCFQEKLNTLDDFTGFSAFWFSGFFAPTDSDFAQNILDFGRFLTWSWVSETWFSNSSPGRGYLHIPISDLDATQKIKLEAKLATSQFDNNQPTNPDFPLQNAGLTPLQGTLQTARDYFNGVPLPNDEGGPTTAPPESCGKDFIALLTDGLPSTAPDGSPLSDPVTALADVATEAANLHSDSVETYVIGFALPTGTDPASLDVIAAAGGTGTAFSADDSASLQAAFDTIFLDILAKTGASSSAATNSTSLSTNSVVYQARFNSGDWNGQLLARPISMTGVINPTANWDAAVQLNAKSPDSRVILTYGRDTNDGIPFRWSDIAGLTDTTTKDALDTDPVNHTSDGLGQDRVDYLRGGTGGSSASVFRDNRVGKLGDIINSTPQYVGVPDAGYNDAEMPGYSAFKTSQSSRTPVLYTGANDGMLHGFDADTGEEVLAYIPGSIHSTLNQLTAPGYGTLSFPHRYFVDGAPMVADADVGGWKTILAGGLNAGGQGIYALDITDPASFSESNAADIVLWEFTDEDDADLGYTFIQPTTNTFTHQSAQIVKMANGKWALIIGNGYNNTDADDHASTTGHAYLFILFIEEGMDGTWSSGDYIKIDTGEGSVSDPNGLATPTPLDTDGDGDVDRIYAGDLLGNLWVFDVSDSDTANWKIAISGNKPLFTAKDNGGNVQSITTAPLVTKHPDNGYMIGFGTGKYIELSDLSDTQTQTVYGIRDDVQDTASSQIADRSELIEQEVLAVVTNTDYRLRITSDNTVNYPTEKGWFIDLPESGERISVNPIIRDGRFVFVSRTPSTAQCSAGGTSWTMEFDYLTGSRLKSSPFDANADGSIDINDFQTVTVNGNTITVPVTGISYNNAGMLASPTVIETDDPSKEYKILSDSNGTLKTLLESRPTDRSGRLSWQEIRDF